MGDASPLIGSKRIRCWFGVLCVRPSGGVERLVRPHLGPFSRWGHWRVDGRLRLRRTARCAAASVLTMWPAGRGEYDRPAGPAGVRSMEPADRRTGQGSDQHTVGTEPVPVSAPDRHRFGHPVVRGIRPERVRDDTAVDLVQRLPLIAHVFDYAPVCDHSRRQGAHRGIGWVGVRRAGGRADRRPRGDRIGGRECAWPVSVLDAPRRAVPSRGVALPARRRVGRHAGEQRSVPWS